MAVLTKTLLAHNLHKYTLELQKAFEDGWRVNPSVVARRSLGNKFSVVLVKNTGNVATQGDVNEAKAENASVEDSRNSTETTSQETPETGDQKDDSGLETEAKTEAEVEAPAKPLTKAQKAKLAKEEAAKAAEVAAQDGEAE